MNAQELYKELQQVTNKFGQFATQTQEHGAKAGGGFLNGFRGAVGGVGHVLQGALGAIGISAGLHQVFDFLKQTIEAGARYEDLSRRFGVSVEVLSALGFQAEKTGTDVESLARSIGFLEKNREKALHGNTALRGSFERLGVSLEQLKTARTEELLHLIGSGSLNAADGVATMGKNFLAVRPLMDDIGRGAVDFNKHLNEADAEN
jgi:hypothetical protein